jgi:hypothetical protein
VTGEQEGDYVVNDTVVLVELAIMHDGLAVACGVTYCYLLPSSRVNAVQHGVE